MSEIPRIVLPHGGYKKLIAYKKSDIIYEGTVVFCRRFLPKFGDRTVDQMIQAARSCKQNIAEGSAASGTSKETEIKLTNVARATLDELAEDYLDWLKSHGLAPWTLRSEKAVYAREFAKKHETWSEWKALFEKKPAEVLCNLELTLVNQTKYLLDRMIAKQEADFKAFGGVRERMHAARTAARGESWDKSAFSKLETAKTSAELSAIVAEMKRKIDSSAYSLRLKRGWLSSKVPFFP